MRVRMCIPVVLRWVPIRFPTPNRLSQIVYSVCWPRGARHEAAETAPRCAQSTFKTMLCSEVKSGISPQPDSRFGLSFGFKTHRQLSGWSKPEPGAPGTRHATLKQS